MENSITRISDLPLDNNMQMSNTYSQGQQKRVTFDDGQAQNYMPINIHPNPYGISTQPNGIPPPEQQMPTKQRSTQPNFIQQPPPQSEYLSEEHQMQLQQLSQQRLPSRDIPQTPSNYVQDEQVKPNYIPKANVSSDYVRDYEDMTEKNRIEYEKKKKENNKLDNIINEFQTPVFIAILFFFFQLPMVNRIIFKKLSFLALHDADGNFNFNGLFMKSVLFGSVYYMVFKIINLLVEL